MRVQRELGASEGNRVIGSVKDHVGSTEQRASDAVEWGHGSSRAHVDFLDSEETGVGPEEDAMHKVQPPKVDGSGDDEVGQLDVEDGPAGALQLNLKLGQTLSGGIAGDHCALEAIVPGGARHFHDAVCQHRGEVGEGFPGVESGNK